MCDSSSYSAVQLYLTEEKKNIEVTTLLYTVHSKTKRSIHTLHEL